YIFNVMTRNGSNRTGEIAGIISNDVADGNVSHYADRRRGCILRIFPCPVAQTDIQRALRPLDSNVAYRNTFHGSTIHDLQRYARYPMARRIEYWVRLAPARFYHAIADADIAEPTGGFCPRLDRVT